MAHKDLELWQMTAYVCDINAYIAYLNELSLSKNKKKNLLLAWAKAHKESPQDEHLESLTETVTP